MFHALLTTTFEGLWAVSFQREYKRNVVHFGLYVPFDISREEKTTQILFMWGKFSLLHVNT